MASVEQQMALDIRPFVFGGMASCFAEIMTFPIDTAKTKLQLQGQIADARFTELKYRGMGHCIYTVFRQEGALALYRGISPAVLRQGVYGTIKFGLYDSGKDLVRRHSNLDDESLLVNVGCGVIAGCISSAIANPTDVIKVRMQARTTEIGQSLVCVAKDIYKREGVAGLWRGVVPTAKRSTLVAGVQLPVYDFTKSFLVRHRFLHDGAVCHLFSSVVAGFCAAAASNPVDVIKTRLMIQRRLHKAAAAPPGAVCQSASECLVSTVRNEGLRALYKGFVPSFSRMGPWNVIFFLVYEQLKLLG